MLNDTSIVWTAWYLEKHSRCSCSSNTRRFRAIVSPEKLGPQHRQRAMVSTKNQATQYSETRTLGIPSYFKQQFYKGPPDLSDLYGVMNPSVFCGRARRKFLRISLPKRPVGVLSSLFHFFQLLHVVGVVLTLVGKQVNLLNIAQSKVKCFSWKQKKLCEFMMTQIDKFICTSQPALQPSISTRTVHGYNEEWWLEYILWRVSFKYAYNKI